MEAEKPYEGMKLYGPYIAKDGRERVVLRDMTTRKQKTVSYNKYVMEVHLGRFIGKDQVVHHIDGDPLNNDIKNLVIKSKGEHTADHRTMPPEEFECIWCGKKFTLTGIKLSRCKSRRIHGINGPFCSRSCSGKWQAKNTENYFHRVVKQTDEERKRKKREYMRSYRKRKNPSVPE